MRIVTNNPFIINRKKILYDQRYTMSRLAIEIGVTPQAVIMSINGKTQSLKLHRAICNKLGVSLVSFWPELYGDQPTESAENIVTHDVGALSTRC
jgi:DNA-binding Xre family transcriptional regulator